MVTYQRRLEEHLDPIVQIRRAFESHRVVTERKQKIHTIQYLLLKHTQIQESKSNNSNHKKNYKPPWNNSNINYFLNTIIE